jgi:hypothetical protein
MRRPSAKSEYAGRYDSSNTYTNENRTDSQRQDAIQDSGLLSSIGARSPLLKKTCGHSDIFHLIECRIVVDFEFSYFTAMMRPLSAALVDADDHKLTSAKVR